MYVSLCLQQSREWQKVSYEVDGSEEMKIREKGERKRRNYKEVSTGDKGGRWQTWKGKIKRKRQGGGGGS